MVNDLVPELVEGKEVQLTASPLRCAKWAAGGEGFALYPSTSSGTRLDVSLYYPSKCMGTKDLDFSRT